MKRSTILALLLACGLGLSGCADVLQRGILGQAYVSTARPAIEIQASGMPLLAGGQGSFNLDSANMFGGLPISMWLAIYGEGGLAPMAIVAQAQTPAQWVWQPGLQVYGSVYNGTEVFGGKNWQATTFIVDPAHDPFGGFVTGVQPDGQPQLWLVRAYMANFNMSEDRIIMQYREPLPEGVTSLSAFPYGQAQWLQEFVERARNAFSVGQPPNNPIDVNKGYIEGVWWQYMDSNFTGDAVYNATIYDMSVY